MKLIVLIFISFLISCNSSSSGSSSEGDAQNGATIYQAGIMSNQACIDCHGTNGTGAGASTPEFIDIRTRSDSEIEIAIFTGPLGMPSYPYSNQEVLDLIAYIRSL